MRIIETMGLKILKLFFIKLEFMIFFTKICLNKIYISKFDKFGGFYQTIYQGRTVICTIHQPASQLFNKFDRLLLLAEGRTAFFGDAKDASRFFNRYVMIHFKELIHFEFFKRTFVHYIFSRPIH